MRFHLSRRAVWNASAANVYLTNASGWLTVNDSYASTVSWDGITYLSSISYYTRNDSTSTIQGIAAHELGHANGDRARQRVRLDDRVHLDPQQLPRLRANDR